MTDRQAKRMTPDLDDNGYMRDWRQWSPEVAKAMAGRDGVQLTDGHWQVISILRDYYGEYEIAPPMRALIRIMKEKAGENLASSRALYQLFPDGPAKQGCRYAGLPKPVSCI